MRSIFGVTLLWSVLSCQSTPSATVIDSLDVPAAAVTSDVDAPFLGLGEVGRSGSFAHIVTLFWRYEPVADCADCRRVRVLVDDQGRSRQTSPMVQAVEIDVSQACADGKVIRSSSLEPIGHAPWAPATAEFDLPLTAMECDSAALVEVRLMAPACLDGARPECQQESVHFSGRVAWSRIKEMAPYLGDGLPNLRQTDEPTAKLLPTP